MRLASVRLASGRFPKRTASITLLGLVPWGETNGEDTVYHSPHSLITVRAYPAAAAVRSGSRQRCGILPA
jgi:hypothetical protein